MLAAGDLKARILLYCKPKDGSVIPLSNEHMKSAGASAPALSSAALFQCSFKFQLKWKHARDVKIPPALIDSSPRGGGSRSQETTEMLIPADVYERNDAETMWVWIQIILSRWKHQRRHRATNSEEKKNKGRAMFQRCAVINITARFCRAWQVNRLWSLLT